MKSLVSIFFALALLSASAGSNAQQEPNVTYTFQQGHSGSWYERSSSGSGITLTVDSDRVVAVSAFSFLPAWNVESEKGVLEPEHVYLVGATQAEVGQRTVEIDLYSPYGGTFFGDPAQQVLVDGKIKLSVLTCDTISYTITYTNLPEPLQKTGTFKKLTGDLGGACVLDCRDPDFGPRPTQCGGRQ
jgi:hypothetical protein